MRIGRASSLGIAIVLAVAGCASEPAPTGTPAASGPSPTATLAVSASSATTPQLVASAPASPAVTLDPSLLGILPPSVQGAPVQAEQESFADAMADPAFVDNVEAAAFGIVVSGSDLASGVVARLRPGRFSDAFFRDWRDTYNQGACAQAGGLVGNAEAELGGRTVYIATCAGGLRTYHAWVAERGIVVSLFSLGEGRFGERLMEGLRP